MAKQVTRDRDDRRQWFEDHALPHLDALYGMALRLTRNEGDAEDLVQEALIRAFRFCDRFELGTNAKAWLFKILTNTFYNQVRKRKTVSRLAVSSEFGDHHDRFISSASLAGRDAETALLDAISSEQLRAAVEALPEEFRIVVTLCDVYEFSYKEIADIIGSPIGTVMSRLYRGRRRLQQCLRDHGRERGIIRAEHRDGDAEQPADLVAYRRAKRQGG